MTTLKLPPFTKALFDYTYNNKSTFCTPGHMSGNAFHRTPVGQIFADFFGENTLKADLSVSMSELGSLLDHSGVHKEAEDYIADVFGADRSYIVTNGTSTSNKIVGQYAVTSGSTILVDRNCHKSITHLMMMQNVIPIYLKPTRNAYGILGGIPKSEFSHDSIAEKVSKIPGARYPEHVVITNSTYDGLFYDTQWIIDNLDISSIHFDSAWVPYTHFLDIYHGHNGMDCSISVDKTVYETQSTHKLLAAFSQASMIHIKGKFDEETMNEAYMMHSSTSPFYPIVASTETSAAIMKGNDGKLLMIGAVDLAQNFKQRLIKNNNDFKDLIQLKVFGKEEDLSEIKLTSLEPGKKWHGFKNIDENWMSLDPIKVTLLTPGINEDGDLEDEGIPAALIAKYLQDEGIIVEKTGPYNLLFLFSIGVTNQQSEQLLEKLIEFKIAFSENRLIEELIPSLYKLDPQFYKNKRIQEIASEIHGLIKEYNLPNLMYKAFDVLPGYVINPHEAFELEKKGFVVETPLEDCQDKIMANMVLPYPPGVPLVMPGEEIRKESRAVLDFLLMLCEIGNHFPGFETDIHGVYKSKVSGKYVVKTIYCEYFKA